MIGSCIGLLQTFDIVCMSVMMNVLNGFFSPTHLMKILALDVDHQRDIIYR